jgi:hypothetical protein
MRSSSLAGGIFTAALSALLVMVSACGDPPPEGNARAERIDRPDARDFACPTREPSRPTPLPTEEMTVEKLREWADIVMTLDVNRMNELRRQLVESQASMARVERRDAMIDGGWEVLSVVDAAARADTLIVGEVTAQYLEYAREEYRGEHRDYLALVSEIQTDDGVQRFAQEAFVSCSEGQVVIAKDPIPPLDYGARYAILAETNPDLVDSLRQVPGNRYSIDENGAITKRHARVEGADELTTVDDLIQLFEEAH